MARSSTRERKPNLKYQRDNASVLLPESMLTSKLAIGKMCWRVDLHGSNMPLE